MSELIISPDLGGDLECEVGDTVTVTVTGTVTAKTPDGGKTINVTAVDDYSHAGEPEEPPPVTGNQGYAPEPESEHPIKRNGKSAVMIMIGKKK